MMTPKVQFECLVTGQNILTPPGGDSGPKLTKPIQQIPEILEIPEIPRGGISGIPGISGEICLIVLCWP